MRVMTGLALPTSGEIRLFGEPLPMRPGQLARIGAALDAPSFPRWLTGRAVLRMLLESTGRPDGGRTGAVLDRVGLAHAADKRVGTYSQGMRQRLALAAALLKRPDLLILDEPTNGLDPEGLRMVRRVIAEESARGAAVLVSSHQLDEIQRICHRVIMVADGRVAASRHVGTTRLRPPRRTRRLRGLVLRTGRSARRRLLMRPLILGEYRRLCRHPLGMTLAVLFVLGSLYCAVGSQSSASASLKNVRNNIETVAQGCETELNSPEQKTRCRKDVPHELKGLRQYEVTFTAYGLRAANGQHPVASVVWTMKLATSVPGLTLVVLVAAFFVAGEWSRGSIVPRLLYEARLSRLLAAKAAAVWLWMLTLVAVSSAVTATVGMLHTRSAFPLPSPGALGEVLAETATVLAAGAAVLAGAASRRRGPRRTRPAAPAHFVRGLAAPAARGADRRYSGRGCLVARRSAVRPRRIRRDRQRVGPLLGVDRPLDGARPLRAVPTLLGIALLWAFLQRRSRTRDLV